MANSPKAIVLFEPSNALTRLTSAFVDKIDESSDIRFQLLWNFGPFFADIPCRLGTNEALDTATDDLVSVYTSFRLGSGHDEARILSKYSRALHALRRCLNDPVKAQSPETLCSIMLLMIHQLLIGRYERPWVSHSRGAAQVLKGRGYMRPRNNFERTLLYALKGSIIIEAITRGNIPFTAQEWRNIVVEGLDDDTDEGATLICLARISDLMQRGRDALCCLHACSLAELRDEVRTVRENFQPILRRFRERLDSFDPSSISTGTGLAYLPSLLHAHFARTFGLALATSIILNCVLTAMEHDKPELRKESARLSDEIFTIAQTMIIFRPLASMGMLICLPIARAVAADTNVKRNIEALLLDYWSDFTKPSMDGIAFLTEWMDQLVDRLNLRDVDHDSRV